MSKKMLPVATLFTHLVYGVILLVIIGLEFLYRQPLYTLSLPAIVKIQANSIAIGRSFFLILAQLGAGTLYFVAFLIVFNWGSRSRAFYYLILLSSCLFTMNITKLAYHEPRPYMVDDAIVPIGCSHEYGNPSGHSLFVAGFFVFMFLDIIHGEHKNKPVTPLVYCLSLVGTIIIVLLMAYDRLYNGVHSINQIIYGL